MVDPLCACRAINVILFESLPPAWPRIDRYNR
jgi:hypothetical protein